MDRKEREQKVIDLYLKKDSCANIAKELNLERKSVYRILERNNIVLRSLEKKKCILCNNMIIIKKEKNRNRCKTCNTNIRRYRIKKKAVDYKGGKCVRCGWSGDISGFDFHHTDPSKKDFTLGNRFLAAMKWELVEKELDKCVLLCAICHRIEHSNYKNPLFLKEAEKE